MGEIISVFFGQPTASNDSGKQPAKSRRRQSQQQVVQLKVVLCN